MNLNPKQTKVWRNFRREVSIDWKHWLEFHLSKQQVDLKSLAALNHTLEFWLNIIIFVLNIVHFADKSNIFELFMTDHKCVSCQKPMPYVENTSTSSLFLKCNVGNMFHKSQMKTWPQIFCYQILHHIEHSAMPNILLYQIFYNIVNKGILTQTCCRFDSPCLNLKF